MPCGPRLARRRRCRGRAANCARFGEETGMFHCPCAGQASPGVPSHATILVLTNLLSRSTIQCKLANEETRRDGTAVLTLRQNKRQLANRSWGGRSMDAQIVFHIHHAPKPPHRCGRSRRHGDHRRHRAVQHRSRAERAAEGRRAAAALRRAGRHRPGLPARRRHRRRHLQGARPARTSRS